MTNEERVKSILADIEHGHFIRHDNLYGDNEQGLKLIEEALYNHLENKGFIYICEECGRELDTSRGDVLNGCCAYCKGDIREAGDFKICGETTEYKSENYCEDCRNDFLENVIRPTEIYLMNRMAEKGKIAEIDTPSVEKALKAKFMLSDPEEGCIICGYKSDTPLCTVCNEKIEGILRNAQGEMYCDKEDLEALAEDYFDL